MALIWDFDDPEELAMVTRIIHAENRSVHICQELSYLNGTQYCLPNPGGLGHPNSEGMDGIIRAMQKIVADCERIFQVPIYSPYTIFTSRVMFVWVNVVGLGIYPLVGPLVTPL